MSRKEQKSITSVPFCLERVLRHCRRYGSGTKPRRVYSRWTYFISDFYLHERKHASPIVPLSMFQNKTLSWININAFIGTVALFGTSSYIPLFLQRVAHLSLFMSGVALLGTAVGWMSVSVPAGKWILKHGYRKPLLIGNVPLVGSGTLPPC